MELFSSKFKTIISGLSLSVGVAIISFLLAKVIPKIGMATIAILLGILLGNTIFRKKSLDAGTKYAESKLLEYSVVLLGFTVTFQTIAKMGLNGLIFVLLMMTIVILSAYAIGRKLGFGEKMSLMFAGGNAVCGSSAIGAIAPAIEADDGEKGQVITLVNLLGTVMMLTLPFLGISIFGDNLIEKSALLGGTLQSVGQVVAGASLINEATVQFAMLFKITRIVMLVFVVYIFERLVKKDEMAGKLAKDDVVKKKLPIPWYVMAFIIICIINSAVKLPTIFPDSAHFISTWFETTALAAIGLRLDFKKFMQEGRRFLAYGLSVGAIQTVAAIGLIYILKI